MRGDVEVDPHAGPRTGEGRAGTDDDGRAGNIENKLGRFTIDWNVRRSIRGKTAR